MQPNNPVAASNLGVTQLWMGRYPEAVGSLELAARNAPNSYRIMGNLADAYRAVPGKEAKAAETYKRAVALAREQLRLNARDALAHSCVATGLAKNNQAAEAATEMQLALELAPKDPDILLDGAVVAALAGRTSDAIGFLRRSVEAGFCRAIIARQPEFERFRKDPAFQMIVAAPRKAAGS